MITIYIECFCIITRPHGVVNIVTTSQLSFSPTMSFDESEGSDAELEMSFVNDCTQLSQDVSHGKYIIEWSLPPPPLCDPSVERPLPL